MIGLPIMYIIIFVENIILLKKAVKSKKILNWIIIFIIEAIMIFVAIDNTHFFETLPTGNVFMGGLNYIGDYIISIAASFLFSGELLVSLLIIILVKVKKNNDNNSD